MTPEEKEKTLRSALQFALNTLEKGMEVRIGDQWPALKSILPETIRVVKKALESTEPKPQHREPRMPEDLGKQIEVSDDMKVWIPGELAGHARDCKCPWFISTGYAAKYARISVTDDDGWKSMDTAPKDKPIRAKMGEYQCTAVWCNDNQAWFSRGICKASGWDRANQPTAWKEVE